LRPSSIPIGTLAELLILFVNSPTSNMFFKIFLLPIYFPMFMKRHYSIKVDCGVYRVKCTPAYHTSTSVSCAGILEQSMGARNQVGIGLSYRPAWLQRLTELIPGLLISLKIPYLILVLKRHGIRVGLFFLPCIQARIEQKPVLTATTMTTNLKNRRFYCLSYFLTHWGSGGMKF
jgi:hypothetical protein